jgi:hypothetical protein
MENTFYKLYKGIFIISFFYLVGCSGYTKKDGKIFLRSSNEANIGVNYSELIGVDYKTFTEIENNTNIYIAKDKNYVFIDASILKGADPKSFEQIKEYYWRDKRNVFLLRFGGDECQIESADASTFILLDDNLWAKDKNNIYYGFKKLNFVNKDKFTVINEIWGKDDKTFYWQELKLDSVNYKTAKIISLDYIKDNNRVFFHNELVVGCDASTFVTKGVGSFGHDKKNMFSGIENEGPITEEYRKTYIDGK